MDDPFDLDDDSFKDALLVLRQITVGPKGAESYEEVGPTVCVGQLRGEGGEDASESVEVPSLAPCVQKTGQRSGHGVFVAANLACVTNQARDLTPLGGRRPGRLYSLSGSDSVLDRGTPAELLKVGGVWSLTPNHDPPADPDDGMPRPGTFAWTSFPFFREPSLASLPWPQGCRKSHEPLVLLLV
jgi:hypothetical protein